MFKSVFKNHGHFIELFFEHLQRRKLEHSLWELYKNPLCATWGYFLLELIYSDSIFNLKLAYKLQKNTKLTRLDLVNNESRKKKLWRRKPRKPGIHHNDIITLYFLYCLLLILYSNNRTKYLFRWYSAAHVL